MSTQSSEEGVAVRQRLYMFAAVLVLVFILILVLGFVL